MAPRRRGADHRASTTIARHRQTDPATDRALQLLTPFGVRKTERGGVAADEIRRAVPGAQVDVVTGDISEMSQVRGLAVQVRERCERLDVLVNNAGVLTLGPQLTVDGFDRMFAVNHLAPFLLTRLPSDLMQRSVPARVVTVASAAHRRARSIQR